MAQSENYADLDDETLAAVCGKRPPERDAWEVFYARFRRPVLQRLRKLGFPDPDTEDLTQDVLLRVFQFLPSFRPGGAPLAAVIFKFTQNAAIDEWRRKAAGGRPVSLRDELYHEAAQKGIPSATVAVLLRLAIESFADPRIRKIAEEVAKDTEVDAICYKLNEKKHFVYEVRRLAEQGIRQQFEAYLPGRTKTSK
jgi:DNA-directed RNA polymerase specialized sigma24 family protein